jgi:glycosyltransferase involved in cell wall biosynthesis
MECVTMRLLYVCSDFGIRPSGTKGASIHLRAITRALSELGHEISLLSPHTGPGQGHPVRPLLPHENPELVGLADRLGRWLKDRDLPRSVAGEMRSLCYNESVVGRAEAALQSSPPDVIIERLSLFGHVGLDLARRVDCPLIIEVNALLSREAKQFRNLEMSALAERIELRVLREADAILTVSKELGETVVSLGIDAKKVHVVPNGADVEAFDPDSDGMIARRNLGIDGEFVVGFAGSLKSWHGVDLLMSAFSQVLAEDADAKLLIVGTGPTEEELRAQALESGIGDSVIFTGAVDHATIPLHLSAMDVTVAPFRSVESFYFSPIKLFEYMAAGRCVVASQLGQIEDVITDGEHGLLCRPENVDSLAQALLRARRDPELRNRVAAAARARVERDYTWRIAAISTNDIFAALAENRREVGRAAAASTPR